MSEMLNADGEDAALEFLHHERLTDGLPVVIPTSDRVEAMLAHSPGLDRDLVLGTVPPLDGCLSIELIAVNAVMAGCKPEIFPAAVAVCEALMDPAFDVGPVQGTVHCVTPLVVVNGPARHWYEIHGGCGALGPGFRANATLGRMLRLVLINAGGGVPGVGDMSALGSPSKFTCCLGEAEEDSPFVPLHVSRGFEVKDSTVTLVGTEGPHSFFFSIADRKTDHERLLRSLSAAMASPSSNNIFVGKGNVAVGLNPAHANLLSEAGMSREDIQHKLWDLAHRTHSEFTELALGNFHLASSESDMLRPVEAPEDILLFVAGDNSGGYSAYFPSWGGGSHGNRAVTKRIRFEEACEIG